MGVARTLDLAGLFDEYNLSPTEKFADVNAMRADWLAVGNDFVDAAASFRKRTVEKNK